MDRLRQKFAIRLVILMAREKMLIRQVSQHLNKQPQLRRLLLELMSVSSLSRRVGEIVDEQHPLHPGNNLEITYAFTKAFPTKWLNKNPRVRKKTGKRKQFHKNTLRSMSEKFCCSIILSEVCCGKADAACMFLSNCPFVTALKPTSGLTSKSRRFHLNKRKQNGRQFQSTYTVYCQYRIATVYKFIIGA